jgi:hypothetical protein
MDALLAILLLKPLLEYFWVFSNPVRIPQWILPLSFRTQRVLFSSVPLHTFSTPSWRSLFALSQNTQQFCLPVHLCTSLNAHLAELSESSVILVFSSTLNRVLLQRTLCICSMPTWQSSTESSVILSATVFQLHSLASKVFNNLEVFLLSC